MESNTTIQAPVTPTPKQVKKKVKSVYTWASMGIIFQTFVALGIVAVLSVAATLLFTIFGLPAGAEDVAGALKMFTMPMTAVGYVAANLFAAWMILLITKVGKLRNWYKKPEKFTGLDMGMSCFAISGVAFAVVSLLSLCGAIFSNTSENFGESVNSGLFADNMFVTVITILYVAVLGPITEEILCRGAILNLSSVVSRRFGIVASAVLFGLMHGNFIQIINATIMGLFLGYVAVKTRSLVAPTILHIFNNSLSVISSFITEKWLPNDKGELVTNIMVYAIMAIGIISMILILRKHGKPTEEDGMVINKVVSDEELSVVEPKKGALTAKLFFTTFSFILVVIYAVGMTVFTAL